MDNQPVLSLCIPTNGAVQWVLPVLDSIYQQQCDLSEFEVVITDNGKDSQLAEHLKNYDYLNLRYIPTTDEGFLNLVTSLQKGRGVFCKMINHRSILSEGSIERMVALVKHYKDRQPIIYFSSGNLDKPEITECKDLDSFVNNLSYWCSWSAGIGFWQKDIPQIGKVELNEMFPNASLLFYVRQDSEYVIWNAQYQKMEDDAGKGGYDLFHTFGVEFLNIISGLVKAGRVKPETFDKVKTDLFSFLTKLYVTEVILPTKHTFILQNIKRSMKVYFGTTGYLHMILRAYLFVPGLVLNKLKKLVSFR